MPQSLLSAFTIVPSTSELYAPSEVQQLDDFGSNATTTTEDTTSQDQLDTEAIDWSRLQQYEATTRVSKRKKSWIYTWGWRIHNRTDGKDYWLYRLCHTASSRRVTPTGHIYLATSTTTSAAHLRDRHRQGEDGPITLPRDSQTRLDFNQSRSSEFDFTSFKALLVRYFTIEQIPFAKVEAESFREMLTFIDARLRHTLPSRRSLRRYIRAVYDQAQSIIAHDLTTATTRINLSFDIWTTPGRRMSLLGVVAHYLNNQYEPRTVLLSLPRMYGSHSAESMARTLTTLMTHFQLQQCFGYAITDNASENLACLDLLAGELNVDISKRHVRCIGHIVNLVAHQVLFGSDIEAFEKELKNVTAEEVALQEWRKKGPIGKLHNVIRYILHSSKRQEAFADIQAKQQEYLAEKASGNRPKIYSLVRDNITRWNSWYDTAVRALKVKQSIDDFLEDELKPYYYAVSQSQRSQRAEPKKPLLLEDRLDADDWHVIARYVALLRPCKEATMALQGNISTTSRYGAVKGAIWQVLPTYEAMMTHFEHARGEHQPLESQALNQTIEDASKTAFPQSIPTSINRDNTRSSQQAVIATTSDDTADDITSMPPPTQEHLDAVLLATPCSNNEQEVHFSTNINLGWQKLNQYYFRSDDTPIYRAAVVLHPSMKMKWLRDRWQKMHPEFVTQAKDELRALWDEYKPAIVEEDESDSNSEAEPGPRLDQYQQYSKEHRLKKEILTSKDSLIPY
jgi:hypothetical protein